MATPLQLDNSEQLHIHLAESAKTMASTDFWKLLVKALAVDEANCLISLEQYLTSEAHPDREEVMTLCLKWHARRIHRRILLDNLRDYRQLMIDAQQEIPEEFKEILLESEM